MRFVSICRRLEQRAGHVNLILATFAVVCLLRADVALGQSTAKRPDKVVATFSVVAFDPDAMEWGVAVQSRVLAVGSIVPFAEAEIGAIATQSYANTTYGPRGLTLLKQGLSAQEVVDKLTADDEDREVRQLGVVDAQGRVANFTGKKCLDWAGGVTGEHFACQGNILAEEKVVQEMARAYKETKGPLADRLVAALEAGQAAGGDKRGMQSAGLLVVKKGAGYGGFDDRMIDLRVDDHKQPITELKRLLDLKLGRAEH
jgi:uncharacterized Ntn-hydrolase superfamily protein